MWRRKRISLNMQTFLPFPSYERSVKLLDDKRLGKQRVEAYQILKAVLMPHSKCAKTWGNHPAVKMWNGYGFGLYNYLEHACLEWKKRGFRDNTLSKANKLIQRKIDKSGGLFPPWVGKRKFHLSHQSNLLRKSPKHYGKYFKNVPNNLPYFWPVK